MVYLTFLNWLKQTRKPQKKYKEIVEEWKEDLEFRVKYSSDKRSAVKVKEINIWF